MKLKWDDEGIKSPLARARGLGSAKEGTTHWFHQRVTAIANLPLMIWLIWSVMHMRTLDYTGFVAWLSEPVNTILMILAVISVFYHAALGCQVIIEDYFHHEGLKIAKLIGTKLFFFAGAIACVFSILKITLGG